MFHQPPPELGSSWAGLFKGGCLINPVSTLPNKKGALRRSATMDPPSAVGGLFFRNPAPIPRSFGDRDRVGGLVDRVW